MFVVGQCIQSYKLAIDLQDSNVSRLKLINVYTVIVYSTQSSSLFFAPMSFFDSTPLGRMLSQVSSDLSIVDIELPFLINFTVGSIIISYSTYVILCFVSPEVVLVIVLMIYVTILVQIICVIIMSFWMLDMTLFHRGSSVSGLTGMAFSYGLSLNAILILCVQWQCTIANSIISIERLEQYMRIPTEESQLVQTNHPPPGWPKHGKVEIRDLKVRYRTNTPLVLQGISCTFEGGQKIGVVGRTGSGKTTLISALFRVVEPSDGKIIIDECDISTIRLHDLRLRIGIILQDPTLFTGSVRYNLDPLSEYSDDQIWKCQLREAVQEKEGGLDSSVLQDGSNWSMGQKQLFCLGRVLLKRSRILVLDEATASIDNATDAILQKTIRLQFADYTVITVAHRIPTVMDYTKVLAISDGKLVEFDEPKKLINKENSLFGMLVKDYWARTEK
ncbi:hypothetical protein KY284_008159 [Solanum tuberosum]|nr:hypothetical protein KY284_008159 [Solanum tuberosum]